ncbi:hypothetical protein [uncultured Algibacter sp.]|uniref:hypothetical protein n=1 Tax=uncultured Algibacter sp. TaxID=298659 RepID=UPI00261FD7F8|nr:hypothetical protein [uncultured Algibacter sp.]
MRKLVFTLITLLLILFYSCNDGDIITVELDFEDTFESCGSTNLTLYKTKEDPSESLSLFLNGVTLDDILEVDEDGIFEKAYSINTSNPFNYRTYSNTNLPSNLFCNDVPNSEVIITQDIESTSGVAILKTVLTEDDNDGVPALLDIDEEKNNDTDGDGIPNFIDADDDGDNILTKDENPDPNGDGDLSDAQDTDGDSIPDYLDDDDDNDGVKTRDEENDSQDNNPANDQSGSVIDPITGVERLIADYLNDKISTTVEATAYREHSIGQTYEVTLILRDIDIQIISADFYDFGKLVNSALSKTRKVTPEFTN